MESIAKESKIDPDRKAIFDAIILDVLTNPDFKDSREFYGTPGDRRFALVSNNDYGISWPEWYTPSLIDFESTRVTQHSPTDPNLPRLIGIRLNKFDLGEKSNADDIHFLDGQIHITILNSGGTGGDIFHIGGCTVYYDAEHDGEKWTIHCNGAID